MSSNERFSDTGSGGRSLRDRVTDVFDRLQDSGGGGRSSSSSDGESDDSIRRQFNDELGGGTGGTSDRASNESDTQAPRGAQRAVDRTPGDTGQSRADTTQTGARAAVDQTPDAQADPNASVRVREQRRRNERRNRTLEDATPGPSASDPNADPSPSTRNESTDDVIQQAVRALGDFGTTPVRDLGDTPVENPVTGNRVETDLNRATAQLSAFAGRRARDDTLDPFGGPQRVAEGVAREAGQEEVAEFFARNRRRTNRVQAGVGEAILTAPTSILTAGKEGAETVRSVAEGETGVEEVGEQGATLARLTATQARDNPFRTAGSLVGDTLLGTAGIGAASRASRAARAARVRARVDDTVSFEDITSNRGAEGELPEFDTSTNAPASEAVREVRDRATDAPEAVQRAVDSDSVLFRSEADRLDADLEAGEGQYELPGLFTSPDASPLRLDIGSDSSSLGLRLPRLSAFEGDTIDAIPDRGAESGRIPDGEGGTQPDPSTGGFEFLTEDADPGTAFVRATGDRTTELEAIFPPGSRFDRSSTLGVELPDGDVATLDVFRQADADASRRLDDADAEVDLDTGGGGDTLTLNELTERYSSSGGRPNGTPVLPPLSLTSGGGVSTGSRGGTGGGGGTGTGGSGGTGTTDLPPLTSPPSGGSGGGSIFDPPTSSPPNTPPTSPPTTPPTEPPTTPPTEPPGGPPSSPPTTTTTTPPTRPPSSPPTSPPSTGGGIPGVPTFGGPDRPRVDPDLSDDDPDERRQRRAQRELDELFSSGFVSGEELFEIEVAADET
jgi:hypothetical protein